MTLLLLQINSKIQSLVILKMKNKNTKIIHNQLEIFFQIWLINWHSRGINYFLHKYLDRKDF